MKISIKPPKYIIANSYGLVFETDDIEKAGMKLIQYNKDGRKCKLFEITDYKEIKEPKIIFQE